MLGISLGMNSSKEMILSSTNKTENKFYKAKDIEAHVHFQYLLDSALHFSNSTAL